MTSSKLVRLAGLALMSSGVLFVITNLVNVYLNLDPRAPFVAFLLGPGISLVAAPLELLGLIGLYARRPEAMGILGLGAFLTTFFGAVLVTGVYWYSAFVAPSIVLLSSQLYELLESDSPGPYALGPLLAYQLYFLGWLLLGVTLLRARLYPRLAVILLIVSSPLCAAMSALNEFVAIPSSAGSISNIILYVGAVTFIIFSAAIAWLGFALWTGMRVSEQPGT